MVYDGNPLSPRSTNVTPYIDYVPKSQTCLEPLIGRVKENIQQPTMPYHPTLT